MKASPRSDVVGSLLRPGYLLEARQAYEAGRIGAQEFKRAEDRAVDEAIQLQESAGLGLPLGYVYAAVPVGSALILLPMAWYLVRALRGLWQRPS